MHSYPMNSRELLKALMDRAGDTANSLARKTKVPQPTIYRFLSGTAAEPRLSTFEPIARHYGVPVEAFLSERARAEVVDTVFSGFPAKRIIESPAPASDDIPIPQFDTGGKMGNGLELRDQPGMIKSWHVDPEWLHKNVRGASSATNLCIVTGFGDSMRPMFNPGDPLLVDRGVTTVEYDAVYFFRVHDEGFIKRLQRIPGRGLTAISENRAYEPWVIDAAMDFEVFGRVLKVWRSEDF
ncbi:LexA family transcriptional regulator [Bordetella avium]|nr:helix-turn-helix domain-containing protein [Bordetella avium]RIQ76064.1 LexA family transcriptional regulator [Bordetella avium]RIQ78728.1 LexA family transcriptional regulator [Bordetella avium]